MVKPEAFWDMVEEVRKDAVDFPLEVRQDRDPEVDYQRSLSPRSPPKRQVPRSQVDVHPRGLNPQVPRELREAELVHETLLLEPAEGASPLNTYYIMKIMHGVVHHRLSLTSLRTMMEIIKIIKTTTIVSVVPTPNG